MASMFASLGGVVVACKLDDSIAAGRAVQAPSSTFFNKVRLSCSAIKQNFTCERDKHAMCSVSAIKSSTASLDHL